MAFYTWTSSLSGESLINLFSSILISLGFEVCEEASGDRQLYAVEVSNVGVAKYSKVSVLISWVGSSKSKCQIEVRSAEPMLMKDTKCENIAKALKEFSPPS